ncbi:hypothetical protein [Pseudomonas frederiksbergensis]|uniref:hypothetical protein n=1 Tax=Pseudomonas frederiksbergensis TaxID=104087 RepID=UPI003D1BCFA1
MDYYLNDVSLIPPYSDEKKGIADLISILNSLAELDNLREGQLPGLRTNIEPWELLFFQGLNESATLGDIANRLYETEHHQAAVYFSTLAVMTPADTNIDDEVLETALEMDPLEIHPQHHNTFPAVLKSQLNSCLCALTSNILISFPTTSEWNFDQSGFSYNRLTYEFDHLSDQAHLKSIFDRYKTNALSHLCIRNFWEQKAEIFPNLRFGLDVRKQITKFNPKLESLLYNRLLALDLIAEEWMKQSTPLPAFITLSVTDESDLTMQNYGRERNFHGDDGIIRTFEKHIWVDRGNRVHIFIHRDTKTVEVGYVGKHLTTWTD